MDSLFPFIDTQQSQQSAVSVPKEYAWDFENNDFVLIDGKTVVVEGLEAIEIWAKLALLTERYRYIAYTWDYGQEFESLIGQNFSKQALDSEIERIITETLCVNPHIKGIQNLSIQVEGSKFIGSFQLITDQGEVMIYV